MDDLQKKLLVAMREAAEKRGEKIITKVIPFTNNDVPEYLAYLDKHENAPTNPDDRIGYVA